MKVAMIEPVCAHGGMDYYDYSLCTCLAKIGCDVKLYVSQEGPLPHPGVEVSETFKGVFGKGNRVIKLVRWFMALDESLKDAARRNARIVHFHFFDSGPLERLNVWAARRKGFKVVVTVHDVESFHKKRSTGASARLLSKADAVIVHNETSKNDLLTFLNKDKLNVKVIKQGHHIEYLNKAIDKRRARAALKIDDNAKVFLLFGHIRKVKGLDIALKAMSIVRRSVPDVRLLIGGRLWKDDGNGYRAIIRENKLDDCVIWHDGFVPQEMIDSYYYASDAVLLPYRRIYQSAVLLMAMSHGVPVVVSDLPAMKEVIKDGENGLVFRTEDYEDLARTMIKAVEDEVRLNRIGVAGRRYVEKNNDWEEIAVNTLLLYEDI